MFIFKTVVVTKLQVFGILFSTSLIFVLKKNAVTKPIASGIFYQYLQIFPLNLTTSLSTTLHNLIFSSLQEQFKSSTFVSKLFKLVGTLTNLLMSRLSISAFKATKSFLAAKKDVSILVACSNFFK